MAWDISSNLGSATVGTGGTDAPASGTVETFVVSNAVDIPSASSVTQTQFRIADAAQGSNLSLAEVMLVTNVNGASWTVMRGAEAIGSNGASPVAHAGNWSAVVVATAGAMADYQSSNIQSINKVPSASGSVTLANPAVSPYNTINQLILGGNPIIIAPTLVAGAALQLWVDQPNADSYTITFSGAWRWVGGTAPTAPAANNRLWCSAVCDGTDWCAVIVTPGF